MSNTRKAAVKKTPTGLRGALAARKARLSHFDIPVADSDVADASARKVERLTNMLNLLRVQDGDTESVKRLEKQVEDAKTELAACFHRIHFRGLSGEDYDALLNEHPPTAEQKKEKDEQGRPPLFNPDTFIPALLEACYVGDDGMTADEWKAELEDWPWPDRVDLQRAVTNANTRPFSDGIPKD